ncbi:diguanylate cyclase [Micromonospora sediminicola]
MLPDQLTQSLSLLAEMRSSWFLATLPVIVVATDEGTTATVLHLELGADVALRAPIEPEIIVQYAKSLLRRRAALFEQSPLTEMPGASAFRVAVERNVSMRRAVAICRLDIDRLKPVVDRYGFARGSSVIEALARALQNSTSNVRPRPFAAHVGGDDFVALCQPRHVRQIANRTVVAFEIAADRLYDAEDRERGYIELLDKRQQLRRAALVTLSIGVALANQRRKCSYESLITTANEMLAIAKSQPGSYVAVARETV